MERDEQKILFPKLTAKEKSIVESRSAEGLIILFLAKLRASYQTSFVLSQQEVENATEILDPLMERMRSLQQALSPELLVAEGKFDSSKLVDAESLATQISRVGQDRRMAQNRTQSIQKTIELNIQGLINGITASYETNGPTEIPLEAFDFANFLSEQTPTLPPAVSKDQADISTNIGLETTPVLELLDSVITAITPPEELTTLKPFVKKRSARVSKSLTFDWKSFLNEPTDLTNQKLIRRAVNYVLEQQPELEKEISPYREKTLKALEKLAFMNDSELVKVLSTSFTDKRSFASLSRILAIMHWARYTTPNNESLSHKQFEKHALQFILGNTQSLFPQELVKINLAPNHPSLPDEPESGDFGSVDQNVTLLQSPTKPENDEPDSEDKFPTSRRRILAEIVQALRAFRNKAEREQIHLEWPITSAQLTRIDSRIKERKIDIAIRKKFINPVTPKGKDKYPMFGELEVAILIAFEKYQGNYGLNERDLGIAIGHFKEIFPEAKRMINSTKNI